MEVSSEDPSNDPPQRFVPSTLLYTTCISDTADGNVVTKQDLFVGVLLHPFTDSSKECSYIRKSEFSKDTITVSLKTDSTVSVKHSLFGFPTIYVPKAQAEQKTYDFVARTSGDTIFGAYTFKVLDEADMQLMGKTIHCVRISSEIDQYVFSTDHEMVRTRYKAWYWIDKEYGIITREVHLTTTFNGAMIQTGASYRFCQLVQYH